MAATFVLFLLQQAVDYVKGQLRVSRSRSVRQELARVTLLMPRIPRHNKNVLHSACNVKP